MIVPDGINLIKFAIAIFLEPPSAICQKTTQVRRRGREPICSICSKASIKELAGRYDLNPKTVTKWKKRAFVHDAPMGPKAPHSTQAPQDLEGAHALRIYLQSLDKRA